MSAVLNFMRPPGLLGCLIALQGLTCSAAIQCSQAYRPKAAKPPISGPQFLHQQNSSLHLTNAVEVVNQRARNQTGVSTQKPADKIENWLNYLDESYRSHREHPEVIARIKEFYFDAYITKPEDVPQSFFDMQAKILKQQGHGTVVFDAQSKMAMIEIARGDQRKSLEEWLDYFLSEDASNYPMWAKYWAFTSVSKLGKFDAETGQIGNRSKGQMSTFPELNREAFAIVVDAMIKKLGRKSLDDIQDPVFLSHLEGMSFGKLYARALMHLQNKVEALTTDGQWITYKKGTDPMLLVRSLRGMNTGWCIAGEATAAYHLKRGDFHIYYSNDVFGSPKIPRVAIRMEDQKIAEIRGTAGKQNLDPKMAQTSILKDKLIDFGPEAERFYKKVADMDKLGGIEEKFKSDLELTSDEVRFLLELDAPIANFGYQKDERIIEMRSSAKLKPMILKALNLKESEVSYTPEEALKPGVKIHIGDLYFSESSNKGTVFVFDRIESIHLPEIVVGTLYLRNEKSATYAGVTFPKKITGNLILWPLISMKLAWPEYVGGAAILYHTAGNKNDKGLIPEQYRSRTQFHREKPKDTDIVANYYE